jgi:hypothetical protein
VKRFALPLLTFALGIAVCWLYRDPQTEAARSSPSEVPYYLYGDRIKLQKISPARDGVHDEVFSLRPYAYNDGNGLKDVAKPSDSAQRWAISLDGGRITVHCEERDMPIP